MAELVWYAAYGSNLMAARFLTYLTGGPVPHSTTERIQDGGRDPSPPRADEAITIPHRLFFARSSKAWGGGGVAFLDPTRRPDHQTPGRAWLITAEQFEDVYRQENGQAEVTALDHDALAEAGHLDVLDTFYGRLIHLGIGTGGHPVATFTCADPSRLGPERPRHHSYETVMDLGLAETRRNGF